MSVNRHANDKNVIILDDFRQAAIDGERDARRRRDVNVMDVARHVKEGSVPPVAGGTGWVAPGYSIRNRDGGEGSYADLPSDCNPNPD